MYRNHVCFMPSEVYGVKGRFEWSTERNRHHGISIEKMGAKSHQSFIGLWYINAPVYLENFQNFIGPHFFQISNLLLQIQ